MNEKIIRAVFDDESITVYQAFHERIGLPAVENQTFLGTPFKMERMTWIKPSFLWMMYRSGWATKADQECVLGIRIKRTGFEWALQNAALATYDRNLYPDRESWQESLRRCPVRIQWDPEKDIHLQPLPYRSIQIGISEVAVHHYVNDWILGIENVTPKAQEIQRLIRRDDVDTARALIPQEQEYPLDGAIAVHIGAR